MISSPGFPIIPKINNKASEPPKVAIKFSGVKSIPRFVK